MKLTEHFTLEEMIHSNTAEKYKIDNTPSQEQIENLKALCEQVLEPTRLVYGKPLTINSGFRCKKLNALVGGVSNSNHTYGRAADIHIDNQKDGIKIFQIIKENCIVDELLYEHSGSAVWIHVSYRRDGHNRCRINSNYRA